MDLRGEWHMQLHPDWLNTPALGSIFAAFHGAGFDIFAVGGCVRNTVLNVPITDIDLSTNATPDQMLALGQAARIKTVPTGVDHGTITFVVDGAAFEVTTFRKDVETDGRRAVVAFADRLEEDSLRRDFTINALYLSPDGAVHDPQNGLNDIDPVRLRFIGNAEDRIREDYLRILRFFRFFAEYGDPAQGFDADGLAACASNADGLAQISKERIGAELWKIMAAPNPSMAVAGMEQAGVLLRVLPGASGHTLAILVHLEDEAPDPATRLAALGDFDWKDLLRLSSAQAARVMAVRAAALSDHGPAALGYLEGETMAWQAMLLRAALMKSQVPDGARAAVQFGSQQEFPLSAQDLMPRLSGPELGRALQDAKDHWIASRFAPGKPELVAWLKTR